MFRRLFHAANRLDLALQARFGRPYHLLLAGGLAVEIGRRIVEIPERLGAVHRLVGIGLILAMECALLIHQVGALAHHFPHKPGLKARTSEPAPP